MDIDLTPNHVNGINVKEPIIISPPKLAQVSKKDTDIDYEDDGETEDEIEGSLPDDVSAAGDSSDSGESEDESPAPPIEGTVITQGAGFAQIRT